MPGIRLTTDEKTDIKAILPKPLGLKPFSAGLGTKLCLRICVLSHQEAAELLEHLARLLQSDKIDMTPAFEGILRKLNRAKRSPRSKTFAHPKEAASLFFPISIKEVAVAYRFLVDLDSQRTVLLDFQFIKQFRPDYYHSDSSSITARTAANLYGLMKKHPQNDPDCQDLYQRLKNFLRSPGIQAIIKRRRAQNKTKHKKPK